MVVVTVERVVVVDVGRVDVELVVVEGREVVEPDTTCAYACMARWISQRMRYMPGFSNVNEKVMPTLRLPLFAIDWKVPEELPVEMLTVCTMPATPVLLKTTVSPTMSACGTLKFWRPQETVITRPGPVVGGIVTVEGGVGRVLGVEVGTVMLGVVKLKVVVKLAGKVGVVQFAGVVKLKGVVKFGVVLEGAVVGPGPMKTVAFMEACTSQRK